MSDRATASARTELPFSREEYALRLDKVEDKGGFHPLIHAAARRITSVSSGKSALPS